MRHSMGSYMLACMGVIETCVDTTLRVSGPLYVVVATVLISGVAYVFFTVLLPLRHGIYTPVGAAHCAVALTLIFNIFFNYFHCIFTNPGAPPATLQPEDMIDAEIADKFTRWCKKCRKPKPIMAHHCHVCNKCVTRMDHHCPWMANCIGHYNYRYFFNFLWWLWLGCLYSAIMATPPFPNQHHLKKDERTGLIFSFILSVAILLALTCLMVWHFYLVATAQTTIEFYNNRRDKMAENKKGRVWVNKFHLGMVNNWQEVFDERGRWWWVMWMLPRRRPHCTTGVFWPTMYNLDAHRERMGRAQDVSRSSFQKGSKRDLEAGGGSSPEAESAAKDIV